MRITPAGTAVIVALISALGVIVAALITAATSVLAALINAVAVLLSGGGCPS
jgi:hypothetical protein